MSRSLKPLFVLCLCLLAIKVWPQWTVRPSFTNVNSCCRFGNSTLCAANNGVFIVDSDGEIQTLVKGSGLSYASVSAICADNGGRFFVVGYRNGTIDLVRQGHRINIAGLWPENHLEPSSITDLTCTDTLIVAASDLGLALLNPDRAEAYAMCRFKSPVQRVAISLPMIFALSSGNVYCIDVTNVNLQDFNNWNPVNVNIPDVFDTYQELYHGPHPKSIPDDDLIAMTSMDGVLAAVSSHYAEISSRGIDFFAAPQDVRFTSVFYNPYNRNHVFVGASSGSVFEYTNLALKAEYPRVSDGAIVGMACTPEGDLLVVSNSTQSPVSIFDHTGRWHYPQWKSRIAVAPLALRQIDDYVFWINLGEGGIAAIDLNATPTDFHDDNISVFYPHESSTEKIGTAVSCIEPDNNGAVYVGTNQGLAYIASPRDVFGSQFRFVRPIATESSPSYGDYSQYVLKNRHITYIEVDAANRKWISTLGYGVFLLSEYCDGQLQHFSSANSPLPSDTVHMMELVDKTGELYIHTQCGLASYITGVQAAHHNLSDVVVYPNPVRPGYSGPISISGLEDAADVRITDLSGRLVFQAKSSGGLLQWDGNNLLGRRCATGVYLVFVVCVDSGDTIVKKLLFVR
ncbi:MAG: T9SS type A sorting domain-containing protein [Bacteroidales bacterium]|nr:T9SS type A sorting domain-containing protein [Bacteroidales bacterium]